MTASRGHARTLGLPILATLFIHGALAGSLEVADRQGWLRSKTKTTTTVEFEVARTPTEPPPPPPPPKIEEVKAPEPPPEEALPKVTPTPPATPPPPRPTRVAKRAEPTPPSSDVPPRSDAPLSDGPPAPGPASTEPPPEPYVYRMESGSGTVAVAQGSGPTGSSRGVRGGTGTGARTGGGGPPDSTGTGGPRVASVASVKRGPMPLGDEYDHVKLAEREYPTEARRLGIEGPVKVQILVTAEGKVAEATLVKGLGHGLDALALELARKLRFSPAVDHQDRPVAVRIVWTFHFKLPR